MKEEPQTEGRRVLVVGAYGLIGAAVSRHLAARGWTVTGLGRNAATARRVLPGIQWIIRDLNALQTAGAWRDPLAGQDFVVNCAGLLQAGPGDDLSAVHEGAVASLAAACADRGIGLVQISAAGVAEDASTLFLRGKARGDSAIRAAGGTHWIYRPGLVLAPTAYGGTLLLRMLAAVPLVQPLAMAGARIQTVGIKDVARAVRLALEGQIPPGTVCDLVEDETHSLHDLVAAYRRWLGFAPARMVIEMPGWAVALSSRLADGLGRLGWRSPLRRTAMMAIEEGVRGDPAPWRELTGADLAPLDETLAAMPARLEDRFYARMALLMPLVLAVLGLFWLASGVIGIVRLDWAAALLRGAGWSEDLARAGVLFWSVVDIALGLALLARRWAKAACWGMIAVSLVYLLGASLATPQLWADPLGPLVKVLPAIILALVARVMLESR